MLRIGFESEKTSLSSINERRSFSLYGRKFFTLKSSYHLPPPPPPPPTPQKCFLIDSNASVRQHELLLTSPLLSHRQGVWSPRIAATQREIWDHTGRNSSMASTFLLPTSEIERRAGSPKNGIFRGCKIAFIS